MRIAIVAYYYEPYKGVGALRPTYWAKHVNEMDPDIICDVITAQPDIDNRSLPGGGKIITIQGNKISLLSYFISNDEGINWRISLGQYFYNLSQKYDVVIFTGGPFLHFFSAKILKKKFDSKIIFDFRDPFANNPNHHIFFGKILIKKFLENKMLKIADVCITVNEYCRELLEINKFAKIEIIDNGFDETLIEKIIPSEGNLKHRFVYAGKLYGVTHESFLRTISSTENLTRLSLDYMGSDHEIVNDFSHGNFNVTGAVPYQEALNRISNADTGIIFTGGQPFESTTKIFDYIGLGKNILIITDGKIKSGSIHNITKNYPHVFWSENNLENISEAIENILKTKVKIPFLFKHKYSRNEGLKKLVRIIHSLK